jgi:AcrR family transcriptional regulator
MMSVADDPPRMARWKPDSPGRLYEAALELYAKRGFENTTVTEIAERAGVTERTFFRHFTDKREVLFGRTGAFEEALVKRVADAPDSLALVDVLAAGLEAAGAQLPDRRTARKRHAIIAANAQLRERDLAKFASLSAALAETLRGRGLPDPDATLAAEVAIAVFRIAFERWISDPNDPGFPELVRELLKVLDRVTAAEGASAARGRSRTSGGRGHQPRSDG